MTKQQKLKAFEMLLDGFTYAEIAKEFDTSRQNIQQAISTAGGAKKPRESIIYPNLKRWLKENNYSVSMLSTDIGFKSSNIAPLYKKLRGESPIPIYLARKIMALTGMSFEVCFELEEGKTENDPRSGNSQSQ